MKVLQINTLVNSGSHGRIAEDIGLQVQEAGGESYIAFGRGEARSRSQTVKIGGRFDTWTHLLRSRLFDRHGFASYRASRNFLRKVDRIRPDIVHLHNIHGYYLHIGLLFDYLAAKGIPVVWTLHDCWAFTGHCSYFDHIGCEKWKTHCVSCPNIGAYPASWFLDRSQRNFTDKRRLFTAPESMVLVTPSKWLSELVSDSFLAGYPVEVIHNGIDQQVFRPGIDTGEIKKKYGLEGKKIILGVASIWSARKGLSDFIKLSSLLHADERIVLIGLDDRQLKGLPSNITGLSKTENIHELAAFYNLADVFVNPTYLDNFPTTNIESLSCGTPVVSYNSGGSPEAVDSQTGVVVPKGDIEGLRKAISDLLATGKSVTGPHCVKRARERYNKTDRYKDYLGLYGKLLEEK